MVYLYSAPFPGYRSFLILFYALLWVYPLFGHGWTRKFGYLGPVGSAGVVEFQIGLLDYSVSSNCGAFEFTRDWEEKASTKGIIRKKVQGGMKKYCETLSGYDGTHDLGIMVDLFTLWWEGSRGIPGLFGQLQAIALLSWQIRWLSMLTFFLLLCSIQLLIFSAIAVMNFEFIKGSKRLRKMAQGFYWTAIAIQCASVVGYLLTLSLVFAQVPFVTIDITKIIINSPNSETCPCGLTAIAAAVLVFLGSLLSMYTVCDLFTDKELAKYAREHGLSAAEKKVLFGDFFDT
jgi:hypothetical protein